ncbi:MAG: hypothetical protein ABIT82_00310 [Ramlibacter sp.]
MQKKLAVATIFIALSAHTASATAQNIHKCGNAYSQQPCAGGTTLETGEARTGAQKSQADATTRRDAAAADAMEKARLKAQAQPAAVYIPPPRADAADAGRPVAKLKKPDAFVATVPAKPGDKLARKKSKAKKKRKA